MTRRVIAAALGFVAGVGLLLAGLVINVIPAAVAGFVVMLACSLWAVTSYRRMTGITTGRVPAQARRSGNKRRAAKGRRAGTQPGSGLMEHGLGLDVQRQAIRSWARQHGHRITGWHSDAGISGSNGLDSREALPDAVAEARAGRAAGLPTPRGRGSPGRCRGSRHSAIPRWGSAPGRLYPRWRSPDRSRPGSGRG